ncbi:hypothetical protein NBRC116591_06000 [Sessilibacter corallicola]|uniref:Uncharacterized protein n=1 Tax=Sessilibacter corallicola TaxID=2904075 RepID=A0ABQ0A573_9GAMM
MRVTLINGHRKSELKESVLIYNYVDYSFAMQKPIFSKRLKEYRALDYTVIEPCI